MADRTAPRAATGDVWPPFAIKQILNGGAESYRIEKKGAGKTYSPTYQAGDLVRAWHKETNGWYLCVILKFDNLSTLGADGSVGMRLRCYNGDKLFHYSRDSTQAMPAHLWLGRIRCVCCSGVHGRAGLERRQ